MIAPRTALAVATALVAGPALAHPGHGESILLHPHVGLNQLLAGGWWVALAASGAAVALIARGAARVRAARAPVRPRVPAPARLTR